jgi:hypothetical protein
MLEIEPETVYFLIMKAREYDEKDEVGEVDPDLSPAEERLEEDMRYFQDDPVAQEIKDTVDGLNDDQQAELVALTWIGRGDFTAGEWREAVRTARERHSGPTSTYLLGTPMLGDYLEEGLSQMGYSIEEMESA